jgi:hypothetical protein
VTSYKANTKNELYYILALVVIIAGGVLFSKKPETALYVSGPFLIFIVLFNLFMTRLCEIRIDKKEGKLTLIYRNYLKKGKELVFDLSNIEFAYKRTDTFKRNDDKRICMLYNDGKEIVKLNHGKDGWTNEEMFDLVNELKCLGVQRKFTGYMMKDAEV